MRLLNTSTLQVEQFFGRNVPEYAILSHTWEKEEVTLQDVESGRALEKKGYLKVKNFCARAAQDGFTYGWLDTCCIDKTSSAELSEAINSMYQWYKNSRVCYAYLSDFKPTSRLARPNRKKFAQCRWWTRGWALQELLAPSTVEFYDADWVEFGTKISLHKKVTEITGIDEGILRGEDPLKRNVAVRMSWAARRRTTRIEDQAYCLLGLFSVNMPLLYGEGERAFTRLQEEIMRVREDYTLFAWCPSLSTTMWDPRISQGLLADSPGGFHNADKQIPAQIDSKLQWTPTWSYSKLSRHFWSLFPTPKDHEPPLMTSRGLRITLPMLEKGEPKGEYFACVSILLEDEAKAAMVCVTLNRLNSLSEQYIRRLTANMTLLPTKHSKGFKYRSIYIMQPPPVPTALGSSGSLTTLPTVSLLMVKPEWSHITPMQCYFSTWLSMTNLMAVDDFEGLTNAVSQINIPSGPKSEEGTAEYADRLQKLTFALSSLKSHHDEIGSLQGRPALLRHSSLLEHEDVIALAMNYPPDQCWFPKVETSPNYRVSGVRGVLGFGHERYPQGGFLVQLGLYDDRAMCNVIPVSMGALQSENNQRLWEHEAQVASLVNDRAVFDLQLQQTGDPNYTSALMVEVTVSIRRVANSSLGVKRYVLSITQKSLSRPNDFRNSQTFSPWDTYNQLNLE